MLSAVAAVRVPVPRSPYTRIFLSYGGERVEQRGGIFDQDTTILTSGQGFRSSLASLQRDTRIGLPFPTAGSLQTFAASFNGGPLGGNTASNGIPPSLRLRPA